MLKKNSSGPNVLNLISDLRALAYYHGPDTSHFDNEVYKSVRAFQMQNVDVAGRPLVVDGKVGPVTRGALDISRGRASVPLIQSPQIDAPVLAQSTASAALAVAVAKLNLGHGEEGGNNRGPHVRKYLNGMANEGSDWCAGFVSWCYRQSAHPMPFNYGVGARNILSQMRKRGYGVKPTENDPPRPGDVIVWWRVAPSDWRGHIGFVYAYRDGILTTIEGNKKPKVARFDYTLSKIDRLLGFARVI